MPGPPVAGHGERRRARGDAATRCVLRKASNGWASGSGGTHLGRDGRWLPGRRSSKGRSVEHPDAPDGDSPGPRDRLAPSVPAVHYRRHTYSAARDESVGRCNPARARRRSPSGGSATNHGTPRVRTVPGSHHPPAGGTHGMLGGTRHPPRGAGHDSGCRGADPAPHPCRGGLRAAGGGPPPRPPAPPPLGLPRARGGTAWAGGRRSACR